MYLLFDISSAQSLSFYFSLSYYLLLSLSLSLMSFISKYFPIFPYFNIALLTCVTLSLLLFSGIAFELFILNSIFLDMYISIFWNFADTAILSILIFCSFYLPFLFYRLRLTCSINSLSLSVEASPTLSSCVPLSNLYHLCLFNFISCPISILLSLSLLLCYRFSIKDSLTFSVSLAQYLTDIINTVFVFCF